MRETFVLTWKEIRQAFLSPIAYAFICVFVVFVAFMFFRIFFLARQVTLTGMFRFFPLAFALVIPGITMRVWAEERRGGTIEFLQTSPLRTWQIVIGKFLGSLTLVVACLLLTLLIPDTVSRYGDLDPGPVLGGYLGALLMASACIAIGMFLSSFTQDQIVAFMLSLAVLLTLVLMGDDFLIQGEFGAGSTFGAIVREISPTTHFESIGRGVIDLRDLYYFLGMTGLFLYLNVLVLNLRKWR